MLEVVCLKVLKDNFAYLVIDPNSRKCLAIDAPDAQVYIDELEKRDLSLDYLLITHYHFDHTAGIQKLKSHYNCHVFGPEKEKRSIPLLDTYLSPEDKLELMGEQIELIETPGHTIGHLAYFFVQSALLFSGDCLFSLGCGRIFEGTLEQMYESLYCLKKLPPHTKVFFGHEYTQNNLEFSLSILPNDPALLNMKKRIEALLASKQMTSPTLLKDELISNLFLRCHESALSHLGDNEIAVFTYLRKSKDRY